MRTWCMTLKSSEIVFNPSQSSFHAKYAFNSTPFQIAQETKYLGVVIQSGLNLPNMFIVKIGKTK